MAEEKGVVYLDAGGSRLPVRISGGDGSSIENAVKIHANSTVVGIGAERAYISQVLGKEGVDWHLELQSLYEDGGKQYDAMKVEKADGEVVTFYFDISEFFGKY